MSCRVNKKCAAETLTVGILITSLQPSQLKLLVTTIIALVVGSGSVGYALSRFQSDLDMKTHVLRDNEERVKEAQIHRQHEIELETMKANAERVALAKKTEDAQDRSQSERGDQLRPRPAKEPCVIRIVLKE